MTNTMSRITSEERRRVILQVQNHLSIRNYRDFVIDKLPRGIDLIAHKDGERHFFAISVLSPDEKGECWGSTNTSEWKIENNELGRTHFIIVALCPDNLRIDILEPEDILKMTTSISFKAMFKVSYNGRGNIKIRQRGKYHYKDISKLLK